MNKTAFTLIELLAVIVILAVIALIATPTIIGLIDNARKESFKNSAYGIVKTGEIYYSKNLLDETNEEVTFTYTDGVESSSVNGKELKYNGKKPQNGQVKVNIEGKIAIAIHNGKYCAEKGYDDSEITLIEKNIEECGAEGTSTLIAAPEISMGMIPIRWNGTTWVKADVDNPSGSNQWYNYDNFMWANVALVTESTRTSYIDAPVGTEVLEENVLGYLVWIPRYRYKLFNVGAESVPVQKIEIVFEDKNTDKSLGSTNDSWLTHPAFTVAALELNGFWIGKFEMTMSDMGDEFMTPTIKPNSMSYSDIPISSHFMTLLQFGEEGNIYGLSGGNMPHMAKNLEWGAVAYLSQSDYGKYGNPIYTDTAGLEKEIYVNNINSMPEGGFFNAISGCAGDTLNAEMVRNTECPATNRYHTSQGIKASTTGSIYGVYDMVGGAVEGVMGGMYNEDGLSINLTGSGFTAEMGNMLSMGDLWINAYAYGTTSDDQTAYNRRILGDATGEVHGWNNDYAYFVSSSGPWFYRGGFYGEEGYTGIFNFSTTIFSASTMSSRLIVYGINEM